ncbi:TonB-dependent receptor [Flavobacterium psychrophilum]|uniref:TonB-dependent receptor n=1 Tax=Flavobacterium psychrophilum TaxID=96345 RepID=UPI001D07B17E|nr:TonB-dependent receptor [Flavobacterium psychrophilum]MCB6226839.1 TonB-dependent receptor [Flavobacterium psychrophilum]
MKNMKKWFLATFLITVSSVFGQGKITGFVYDENGPLPGASILIEGDTNAISASFDGSFTINSASKNGKIEISFLGYKTKKVTYSFAQGEKMNLGNIILSNDSNLLGEVVIKSTVIDLAKDRKTPVAVSTIKGAEIREKLGSQEFPEILANTPSVYVTKAGGGFGDSRINIRGFDQKNIAVMVNGVPVNDMESGAVYWSNWSGLSDVTSALQVQRGLGSSKLAVSSVGGTINVITRTADMKEGGTVSAMLGNNDYLKTLASYSTGKMKNGLSASVLFCNTQGSGYVNGTKFSEQNYFIGLGYEFNEKHNIQFTFTGAPQWHNQRSTSPTIAKFIKYGKNGEPNIHYNSDYGYLNGEEYSFKTNYYHKPVASFNYDFKINDKTKLSTILYGSWGRGGGSNGAGAIRGNTFNADNLRNSDGTINVNLIQAWNSGSPVSITPSTGGLPITTPRTQTGGAYQNDLTTTNNGANGISKISSINSHDWYGGVINLSRKLSDKLTLDFGIDARTYKGFHYTNLNDLLGATNYKDVANINNTNGLGVTQPRLLSEVYDTKSNWNPFFNSNNQERINFNNDGIVKWLGAFTQLEYSTEKITAFIQGAVSQQGFKRVDYFKYKTSDPLSATANEKILGGNVKGGVNYNLNEKMNVFVNAGYYSKQPFFNAVYPNNASLVNGNLVNEKIIGFEAGYGFKSSKFNANLNVYHTTWKDRYQRQNDTTDPLNVGGYYDFSGITEVHSGAELEMNAKPLAKLGLNAMVSVGNWVYKGNSLSNRYDNANNSIGGGTPTTLYLDGLKVGDAAQMTASIGANYEVAKGLKVDANYRLSDKLYAGISPNNFKNQINKGSLELPNYGLMDAGITYKINRIKDSKDSFTLRVNVNNVLDKIYISESRTNQFTATEAEFNSPTTGSDGLVDPTKTVTATNALKGTGNGQYTSYQDYQNRGVYNGVDVRNQVYFGFGRTWNFGISYNF